MRSVVYYMKQTIFSSIEISEPSIKLSHYCTRGGKKTKEYQICIGLKH